MTRVFLKLYFLLVLPLLVLTLLPKSPLSILSDWWFEREAYRQYSAIYPLVKEELDLIPKVQWIEKVEEISQHFAYPLLLKKRSNTKLKENTLDKINDKGFALTRYNKNSTLVFDVKNSDFLLYVSLYNNSSSLEEFEKDTRGFRYFLNKIIKNSENPIAEFERIKPHFSIELEMLKLEDFKNNNSNKQQLIDSLLEQKLFIDDSEKVNMAYLLSDDKQFIIKIVGTNQRATFRRYYQYISFIIPALLLALGALIWIYLFRNEFKKLNAAAKSFGSGQLDTRIQLSKNSALYPISDSFNDMATRIQALLGEHKDLTNAVSHELKTPLSRLHFALEMQKISNTKAEHEVYTQKIENNIFALENLVDELLSYTRLQRQQTAHFGKYCLQEWLNNELDNFKEYHPKIKIIKEIHTKYDVLFDEHLLSRALNNLLENAANYANSEKPLIKITAKFESGWILLSVEDNGGGIDPKDCNKIFEPFTRLDKSRQRKDNNTLGGYGMGLAIVKSIIQQHKGDVSCEKSDLGGALFTLKWQTNLK